MTRRAIATKETVAAAVEKLLQAGLHPTVAHVRDAIGGGSHTTISEVLSQVLADRRAPEPRVTEMPEDLAKIAQQAALAIYTAIQKTANCRVDIVERDAESRVSRADHARREAELEIESLERDAVALSQERDLARESVHEASARAERAEAQLAAIRTEVQRLRDELGQAREAAERARGEEAELRGRLSAEVEGSRQECARLAAQIAAVRQRQQRGKDRALRP